MTQPYIQEWMHFIVSDDKWNIVVIYRRAGEQPPIATLLWSPE